MYLAYHLPHTPLQAPQAYIDEIKRQCATNTSRYGELCGLEERFMYLSMVKALDDMVYSIELALKANSMYDNTAILFVSDNGAPEGIYTGGNAFPFRGGKASDFDGGFRVPGFIGGGYVEKRILDNKGKKVRGLIYDEVVHISDWYATFCELAGGVACTGVGADVSGDRAGLRPVDSVSLMPYISSFVRTNISKPAPHSYLHLSPGALLTTINGTLYKLVTGTTAFDLRSSPTYPNCTYTIIFLGVPLYCGNQSSDKCCERDDMRPKNPSPLNSPRQYNCGQGCLFDIEADETELYDICEKKPDICAQAMRQLVLLNQTNYEPFHGCHLHAETCNVFKNQWNITYGPFINVDNCPSCIRTTKQYFNSSSAVKRTMNDCQCLTSNSTCVGDSECVWSWGAGSSGSCDLKPELRLLTLPERMAIPRFQNYTKGSVPDNVPEVVRPNE